MEGGTRAGYQVPHYSSALFEPARGTMRAQVGGQHDDSLDTWGVEVVRRSTVGRAWCKGMNRLLLRRGRTSMRYASVSGLDELGDDALVKTSIGFDILGNAPKGKYQWVGHWRIWRHSLSSRMLPTLYVLDTLRY